MSSRTRVSRAAAGPRAALVLPAALFAVSYLLPATTYRLPVSGTRRSLMGWEAFLVSLSALAELDVTGPATMLLLQLLTFASGLTNVLFVAALVTLARTPAARSRSWALALGAAVLINLVWVSEGSHLHAGYFTWMSAFISLALVAGRPWRSPHG